MDEQWDLLAHVPQALFRRARTHATSFSSLSTMPFSVLMILPLPRCPLQSPDGRFEIHDGHDY
jgi:hypothetical protein